MRHHGKVWPLCVALLLSGCDSTPTGTPQAGGPLYTICSTGGDCGPNREVPGDTTTTQSPGAASYEYWSSATMDVGPLGGPNYIDLRAVSRSLAWVATTSVDARYYSSGTGCNTYLTQFGRDQKSASGSPVKVEVGRRLIKYGGYYEEYKVTAYHSFTPVSGATGGGTHYSTDERCFW